MDGQLDFEKLSWFCLRSTLDHSEICLFVCIDHHSTILTQTLDEYSCLKDVEADWSPFRCGNSQLQYLSMSLRKVFCSLTFYLVVGYK